MYHNIKEYFNSLTACRSCVVILKQTCTYLYSLVQIGIHLILGDCVCWYRSVCIKYREIHMCALKLIELYVAFDKKL